MFAAFIAAFSKIDKYLPHQIQHLYSGWTFTNNIEEYKRTPDYLYNTNKWLVHYEEYDGRDFPIITLPKGTLLYNYSETHRKTNVSYLYGTSDRIDPFMFNVFKRFYPIPFAGLNDWSHNLPGATSVANLARSALAYETVKPNEQCNIVYLNKDTRLIACCLPSPVNMSSVIGPFNWKRFPNAKDLKDITKLVYSTYRSVLTAVERFASGLLLHGPVALVMSREKNVIERNKEIEAAIKTTNNNILNNFEGKQYGQYYGTHIVQNGSDILLSAELREQLNIDGYIRVEEITNTISHAYGNFKNLHRFNAATKNVHKPDVYNRATEIDYGAESLAYILFGDSMKHAGGSFNMRFINRLLPVDMSMTRLFLQFLFKSCMSAAKYVPLDEDENMLPRMAGSRGGPGILKHLDITYGIPQIVIYPLSTVHYYEHKHNKLTWDMLHHATSVNDTRQINKLFNYSVVHMGPIVMTKQVIGELPIKENSQCACFQVLETVVDDHFKRHLRPVTYFSNYTLRDVDWRTAYNNPEKPPVLCAFDTVIYNYLKAGFKFSEYFKDRVLNSRNTDSLEHDKMMQNITHRYPAVTAVEEPLKSAFKPHSNTVVEINEEHPRKVANVIESRPRWSPRPGNYTRTNRDRDRERNREYPQLRVGGGKRSKTLKGRFKRELSSTANKKRPEMVIEMSYNNVPIVYWE